MIVWVLVMTFYYGQNPVVIDNIASKEVCEQVYTRMTAQEVAISYPTNHVCLPVRKVKP